ncbi:MAG TPA: hypothetical protein VK658_14800 [Chryseolinea sp.]|nr:hypothetical protein [Chryseolinea sp.]
MKIKLSETLSLPLDAATQTFAFIGRKGSGKSYGSGKLVELLIDAGIQVAILDTVGNWYGLRLAADGKSKGIDIPIIGGLRGDIPLEPTGGTLVADILIDSGRSLVIDASQFTKVDRQRFATAFGAQLWKRKKAEHNPTPVMLVLEESQLIIPEAVRGDSASMVGIYEEIIRLGRNYGIGVTMITQRPQSVNKEVLNQTECLMAFQVNGAHERKAIREWIVHQGMDVKLIEELPSLKPGECYVWSPQWLDVLQKIKISKKRTFDSTSTPKAGGTFRGKALKEIDLAEVKEKMKATIERAKAEDPRELKKRIAELEKLVANGKPAAPQKVKEVNVLSEAFFKRAEKNLVAMVNEAERHGNAMALFWENQDSVAKALLAALQSVKNGRAVEAPNSPAQRLRSVIPNAVAPVVKRDKANGPIGIGRMERAILQVLAQRNGRAQTTKSQLGILSGYSSTSGSFSNALSRLRTAGMISGSSEIIGITGEGLGAIGPVDPMPTGEALQQYWFSKVGRMEQQILTTLLEGHPGVFRKEELGTATGYSWNSGSFSNALSKLRTLQLIEGYQDIKAADVFFEN